MTLADTSVLIDHLRRVGPKPDVLNKKIGPACYSIVTAKELLCLSPSIRSARGRRTNVRFDEDALLGLLHRSRGESPMISPAYFASRYGLDRRWFQDFRDELLLLRSFRCVLLNERIRSIASVARAHHGHILGKNDSLIMATAIHYGYALVTLDNRLLRITNEELKRPWWAIR